MTTRSQLHLTRRAGLTGLAAMMLVSCGKDDEREIKGIKAQVQDAFGAKNFAKGSELAQKGFALAREKTGDTGKDTLYFAQALTENAMGARNFRAAKNALKVELDLRAKAGQNEKKLQGRRTLLIKLAEENADRTTAIEQTVIVAKGIEMGAGKDPQPTYRTDPTYPPEQYRQKIEGDVDIAYNLDADGTPQAARVTKSVPAGSFDSVALEAFKKWRFTPYIEKGEPVASTGHHFTIAFRMGRKN